MPSLRSRWVRTRYALLTRILAPFFRLNLWVRRLKGKEHPIRWREKLGHPSAPRPAGALVWLHAVGLGEVLSTRPIIHAMLDRDPDLNFLVTSGTRASAEIIAAHMPPRTTHQFLPIDTPKAAKRFLRHWKPDLTIWVEQDIWPGLVFKTLQADIPLALVNGRMNGAAAARRQKAKLLYTETYSAFGYLSAQDGDSAANIAKFARANVQILPNLKSIAPPLSVAEDDLEPWRGILADRAIWAVGSAHLADVEPALLAHKELLKRDPRAVLVILPRALNDVADIRNFATGLNLEAKLTSEGAPANVLIEPTFGASGLWYSLSAAALIGGGFDDTGGHNPWEAVHLGCGVLYGPNTANFMQDYETLERARGTQCARTVQDLARLLQTTDFDAMAKNATWAVDDLKQQLAPMFDHLCAMIRRRY